MAHTRKLKILLPLGLIVITGIAAIKPAAVYKERNLQVLPRDISDHALDSIMDTYKYALGVKCNFCHARNASNDKLDFASDAKPEKEIARNMMRMTMDINKKYFNFNNLQDNDMIEAVSCKTCHRGEPHPAVNPNEPPAK